MSHPSHRKFAGRYFLITLLLWLILVAAYATWAFLIPHDFDFGGQIGPLAGFLFFVILYSLPYAIVSLIIFFLISPASEEPDARDGA